jgi:formate transporter
MYFVPFALLVESRPDESFWQSIGSAPSAYGAITMSRFLWTNLLPVTLGNIVGGGVMVGFVYWVVYCRKRPS